MKFSGFGRIASITSAMVKTPHAAMGLSNAARAGLTAVSKALARAAVADDVPIDELLPERLDTPRQAFMAGRMMAGHGITRDGARRGIADTLPARRLGRGEELGAACAFRCAALGIHDGTEPAARRRRLQRADPIGIHRDGSAPVARPADWREPARQGTLRGAYVRGMTFDSSQPAR
jgi:NAD(P)-dependent dehydrogenase (short-subunit alcohol dehydrogenase family)